MSPISVPTPRPAARPLTFVFNGGPGASSAYLHLGAMGPWRLPLDNITPSSSPDRHSQSGDVA